MPLYMDIHTIDGVAADVIAEAHKLDLAAQQKYGVDYRRYWHNETCGKLYCLVHAPSPEAAQAVHAEAHGMLPERIIEVDPEIAEGLLGSTAAIPTGLVVDGAKQPESAIRTILFTDIADSTALTQKLGDEGAMELVRSHDDAVRTALRANGGREVKHTGDGIMAAFHSTASAVRCAAAIQVEIARLAGKGSAHPLRVRIGLAAGEPLEQHGDLFGTAVQLAARLCARAEPGGILVSNVVVELCAGKGFRFEDGGEVELKGFDRPARVHSVDWSSAI
jgi:class 3 adenylate cyclase